MNIKVIVIGECLFFYIISVAQYFLAERRKKEKGSSPLQDEPEEEEPLDEETQAIDQVAMERIRQILKENEEEMNNFELKKEGN